LSKLLEQDKQMTKQQLDAIQKNVDFDDVSIHDVIPLLSEVERLTAEVEKVKADSSWGALKRLDDEWRGERDAAFSRGVAAMREAARMHFVNEAKKWQAEGEALLELNALRDAGAIRALPDPEDKYNGK
jgi:hypothetical protein